MVTSVTSVHAIPCIHMCTCKYTNIYIHTYILKGSANPSRKQEPDHVIYLHLLVGDKVGIDLVKHTIL